MKYLFLALLFITITACNYIAREKSTDPPESLAAVEQQETTDSVVLDNGKKWIANPETTEGIENMKVIAAEAMATHQSASVFLPDLEHELNTIFEKCTMTGEAHEQLHHFLVPLKKQLENLGTSQAGEVETQSLIQYLDTYSRYFE